MGVPESVDASSCPLPQPARSWVWLVDLERVCALLIGRCLGGMLVGSPMSADERETSGWLVTSLFCGGTSQVKIMILVNVFFIFSKKYVYSYAEHYIYIFV